MIYSVPNELEQKTRWVSLYNFECCISSVDGSELDTYLLSKFKWTFFTLSNVYICS
jgi:hypothetical protein